MKSKILILSLIATIIGLTICYDLLLTPKEYEQEAYSSTMVSKLHPERWQLIPNVSFSTIQGENLSFKDFEGKVVLLNFWATWCPTCINDFPGMLQLAEKFREQLVIVAISNDDEKAAIDDFMKLYESKFKQRFERPYLFISWDKDKNITSNIFNTVRFPETIVISKDSKMVKKLIGEVKWDSKEIELLIQQLVMME
jgi:thiol-disulfide isomerase/thioredoxin